MRPRRSRILLVTGLVAFAFVALILGRQAWQMWKLAHLEACFPGGTVLPWFNKPRYMPEPVWEALLRKASSWWGYKYYEDPRFVQLLWLCGGEVVSVHIHMTSVRGDAGAAVSRYATARSVILVAKVGVSEQDVANVCDGVRRLPLLEEAIFQREAITDTGVAPLAGHPRVRKIRFFNTSVSTRSIPTLASLPSLRQILFDNEDGQTDQQRIEFRAALPSVKVGSERGGP